MSHERTFTFSMVNGMLSITHPDHPGETQVPIRTTMTEAKKEAIKVFLADHYVSMVEPNFRKPLDLLDPAGAQYPDYVCLLYTSPSPRDRTRSRMPSSA